MTRWHNREAILAEFTTASLRSSAVEDFTIECSSSDEDVPFAPKVHVIQTTCLPTSAKLPKKIEHKKNRTKRYISVKEDQHCQAFSTSTLTVLNQKLAGLSKERESCLQECTGEKTCMSTMCGNEIKFSMSGTEGYLPVYTINDFDKTKNKMGGKETEHILPLSGSYEFQNETLSHHSGACDTVFEPQSPVLGLIGNMVESPIIKTKKMKVKNSSPLFGSHKVPKRKLDLDGIVPVERQVTSNDKSEVSFTNSAGTASSKEDQIIVNSDYVPHIDNDFDHSNTKTRKLNDVGVAELVRCNGKSTVGQVTQGLVRISCPITPPGACNVEQTPSDHSVDHSSDQIIQSSSCESLSNSRISDTDPKSAALRDPSLPRDEQGLCVGDHASQSIAVATEGTNSQLNYDTEPSQYSFDATYTISEDSESYAPQASSDLDLIGQESNTRSGFDWVKHLQTPKKLSSSEKTVDGVESAKKKLLKHGQAERLKQLLVSWRSDISIWNHELSLRTLLGTRQSPSLPSKVLHYTDSTIGGVKPEPQGKISDIKTLASPSVRNLQDFLIENPTYSPVSALWSHPHSVSQKYLELKLVEVGGQLPSNAALCEAIDSNVEDFQTSLEVKVEYTEATETKKSKKKFLVFFSLNEHSITTLNGIDFVRVYAPWQNLNLPNHDIPALFTSCFKLHFREEEPLPCPPSYKKTVLNTLTCRCQDKAATISLCCTESYMIPWKSTAQAGHTLLLGVHSGFTTIRDTPEKTLPQSGKLRAGTILEALEKCGGVSAVPVSITIRIHRTITRRDASGSVDAWELIGQDAAGQFCVVKIPNWPLAQNLKEALCDPAGHNSTFTLTHLTMTQRLTNIQDPGLFSMLTSLHNAYQSSVLGDPHLQPLLQDVASRPPQTHCYVLTVSLGVTTVVHGEEQVTLPIQLPHWTLQEAQTDSSDGQRGSISVYAVYKSGFSMHVVSPTLHKKGSSTMLPAEEETKCSRKEEGSKPKKDFLISRVLLMGAALPPWMPENGPVMLHVLLRDAVVWHGSVVVDEYSLLQLQEESSTKIDVLALNQFLCPLSTLTHQESLTLVSGTIIKVDEENAFIYLTCSNCNSDRVQETKDGRADCPRCDQKSALPCKTYSLEVWLDCGPGLEQAAVKVKLYQKTIEKLLSTYCESQEEEYSATSLLGCQVGPMPCVLLQLERPRHCSIRTYNLAELPY